METFRVLPKRLCCGRERLASYTARELWDWYWNDLGLLRKQTARVYADIVTVMLNRKNKVILLVEPEQRLSPVKLVLKTEQYNVLTADNMTNLRHLIGNYPVNAVIVDADANAEQYDCAVAAEQAKAIRPEVPVILLSSRHWVGKDYCDGADYNMVKGASPVEMIRAIEKIMVDPQPEVQIESARK